MKQKSEPVQEKIDSRESEGPRSGGNVDRAF